jgi:hypothetical protein
VSASERALLEAEHELLLVTARAHVASLPRCHAKGSPGFGTHFDRYESWCAKHANKLDQVQPWAESALALAKLVEVSP